MYPVMAYPGKRLEQKLRAAKAVGGMRHHQAPPFCGHTRGQLRQQTNPKFMS
jgi:hypothetical protein